MHGLGCCPLLLTVPEPGGLAGSLTGAADSGGGNRSAGSGFIPLFTDGAGMTWPGATRWSHRAAGAGQQKPLAEWNFRARQWYLPHRTAPSIPF